MSPFPITPSDDRKMEIGSSSLGQSLLTATGPIMHSSIEQAIDRSQALLPSDGLSIVLCNSGHGDVYDAQHIQALKTTLVGHDIIGVGPETKSLISSLGRGTHLADIQDFIGYLKTVDFSRKGLILHGPWSADLLSLRSLLEQQGHQTNVTINLEALAYNLSVYRELVGPDTELMVMVKAFAYGNGDTEVAHCLQLHKADRLAVAFCDEGVALRQSGITLPIMVLNCSANEYTRLIAYDLEPEVYSLEMLRALSDFASRKSSTSLAIHLMVDTGMHRLGIDPEELDEALQLLSSNVDLNLSSVMSHLFASDGEDEGQSITQLALFDQIRERVLASAMPRPDFHVLNSAGISRFPKHQLDMVRLGIGLYGFSGDSAQHPQLRPVLSWHTAVSQVKEVRAGETVGYGGILQVKSDTRIAILPLGYADGLSRKQGNGQGKVLIEGKRCPFIGNICMDMSMVDIGQLNCSAGDSVTIIGDGLDIKELASDQETIPYEVLTSIPPRVKRSYVFDG